MAYGKIKADAIIYDDSGSDVEKTIAVLASAASTASPTFTGDVTLTGAAANVVFDASDNALEFADNAKGTFGTGSDFSIYHDGSGSYLQGNSGGVGNVYLDANGSKGIYIRSGDGASGVHQAVSCVNNAQVELYHDNTKKFETTAAGVTVAGSVTDDKGNLRSIPKNTESSAYVPVAADAGKAIVISSGGVTINNSVFTDGDALTIINHSGSDQTITQGSSFSLHNTADGSLGNRTLAGRGMATIWFSTHNEAYISGSGLS